VPTASRLLLLVAGALAAVALFVFLRDEDDGTATSPRPSPRVTTDVTIEPIEIRVRTESVIRVPIPRGRRVVLVVTGPPGEEVHLHGYDVKRRIGPNGVVRIPFRATIPGRFEVEVEASHRQIADLTVR
jgi:hypothetical protein